MVKLENIFWENQPILQEMGYNLRWVWDSRLKEFFRSINPAIWDEYSHPLSVLHFTPLDKILSRCAEYQKISGYDPLKKKAPTHVAYFCAEYGFHETLPIYSGGLGILAADHCKEASDLDIPLVAVGLFYKQGFFSQTINKKGKQEHGYQTLMSPMTPLRRVIDPKTSQPLVISIQLGQETIHAQVWNLLVGNRDLFLLDTDIDLNILKYRYISRHLYVSGRENRLLQEIVLGIGGIRALEALGIAPKVYHLNEGHSAFLLIQRMMDLVKKNKTFAEAVEIIHESSVFTIHTPVPAGNEKFHKDLVTPYLKLLIEGSSLPLDEVLKMGTVDGDNDFFDMTAFCLRLCHKSNGVSQLHGVTAHDTWSQVARNPLMGITNGVHQPSWKALSEDGDDAFLWAHHQSLKQDLFKFAQKRIIIEQLRNGLDLPLHKKGDVTLKLHNPETFVIGFARRFAAYKRANLIFNDPIRLKKILTEHNVILLFAGKAHPADESGQSIIAEIHSLIHKLDLGDHVYFIENYDIALGRALVQGSDVWLNNPLRPLEASGTSGMKAAMNGVLNISTLDGWWDEAYEKECGWAIGGTDVDSNQDHQLKKDADSLYHLLETEIIPTYRKKDKNGLPVEWISKMRKSIKMGTEQFSTERMLKEYKSKLYGL